MRYCAFRKKITFYKQVKNTYKVSIKHRIEMTKL